MITNERQYRITKAQLENFRKSVEDFDIGAATKRVQSKVLAKAELAALRSEYENLSMQIQEYETLKSGAVQEFRASTLEELPSILIRARIAKGLSQRQLADALELREQQVQRYEAEGYASANLRRLAEVARKLKLNITEIAEFRARAGEVVDQQDDSGFAWDQFPVREMYRRNWFEGFTGSLQEALDNAEELVRDFVEGSIDKPVQSAARLRARVGGNVSKYALIAWQCRIISLAKKKLSSSYKKAAVTKEWLTLLAQLSREEDGPRKAIDYLEGFGIPLVIEPHLPQTYLDGAAFWLTSSPVIGMTLRYDRLDNFWFVLFHELVHVIKHLQKGVVESIFDNLEVQADDIEQEADEQAGEILVPSDRWETALARYVDSEDSIKEFADELGVSPAIIAGKIRLERDNWTILTNMVGQGGVRKLFPEVNFS